MTFSSSDSLSTHWRDGGVEGGGELGGEADKRAKEVQSSRDRKADDKNRSERRDFLVQTDLCRYFVTLELKESHMVTDFKACWTPLASAHTNQRSRGHL